MRGDVRSATAGLLLLLLAACGQQAAPTTREPSARIVVEPIRPKGDVAWPLTFEWKTTAGPTGICRVTVFDEAERTLLRQETRHRRLEAPENLRRQAGLRRLSWRVSVLNDAGDEAAVSPLVSFAIR